MRDSAAEKASAAAVPAASAAPANGLSIRPSVSGSSVPIRTPPSPTAQSGSRSSAPFSAVMKRLIRATTPFSMASTPPISPFAAWKAKSPMAPGSLPQIATAAS